MLAGSTITAIKEAAQYRGQSDAVHGDRFNLEVREAAKECLDVVYSDSGDAASGAGATGGSAMSGQLQGGGMAGLGANSSSMGGYGPNAGSATSFGGGGYGAPMGGAPGSGTSPSHHSSSSSRMEGIGNPMFADPRLTVAQDTSGMGRVAEMASSVGGAMLGMIKDPLARGAAEGSGGMPRPGGGYGGPDARDPYAQPPGRANLAMQTGGQWTMASNRGPNAVGSAGNAVAPPPAQQQQSEYYKARNNTNPAFSWASGGDAAQQASGVGGSWGAAAVPAPQTYQAGAGAAQQQPAASPQNGVAATSSAMPPSSSSGGGDYEKNLISELCPPGGMKAEPPADKLEEFARAVPSLDPDLVCPALLDALEEGNPWIMRAKALCVIDAVLKVEKGLEAGTSAYSDFFHACSAEIEPLGSHARPSVRGPARRVLAELGIAVGATAGGGGAQQVAAPAAPQQPPPNLLDFDEPAPAAEAAAPAAAPSGGGSLFGGLTTKSEGAPPAASPQAAQQPQQVVHAPSGDLLGGMGDAPPVQSSARGGGAGGGGDLFGDVTVAEPVANGVAPTAEPGAAAPIAGSAFGFMNGSGGGVTPAPPQPAAPPPVEAPATPKQAFDPLLSLGMDGPSSAPAPPVMNSPVGAASPGAGAAQMAQMQMAYQQNMMMMQQQMAQMQMSYQRQGSSGGNQQHPGVMGGNYMRQVPGMPGGGAGGMSSFSFLDSDPNKRRDNKKFDFVQDAMKSEKK